MSRPSVEAALEALEPEVERAERTSSTAAGPGPQTARYLAGKGFGEESLDAALGAGFATGARAAIG